MRRSARRTLGLRVLTRARRDGGSGLVRAGSPLGRPTVVPDRAAPDEPSATQPPAAMTMRPPLVPSCTDAGRAVGPGVFAKLACSVDSGTGMFSEYDGAILW